MNASIALVGVMRFAPFSLSVTFFILPCLFLALAFWQPGLQTRDVNVMDVRMMEK